MNCRPELTTWVATGPNGEPINVRKYGGTKPYYDFEFGGESVQSRSVEDGIAIISKRAQYARLLAEMCASYGLMPDASRNAGQMGSLKRDLVFGDLLLTVTHNKNSFYDGQLTRADEPRKTIWQLCEVTIDELFEQARNALSCIVTEDTQKAVKNIIMSCVKVGWSNACARECIRGELSSFEMQSKIKSEGRE